MKRGNEKGRENKSPALRNMLMQREKKKMERGRGGKTEEKREW